MTSYPEFGWSLDASGWPADFKSDAPHSISSTNIEKVLGIIQDVASDSDPAFGHDHLLLEMSVQALDSRHHTSTISFSHCKSCLWADQHHAQPRLIDANKTSTPEDQLCDILLPWERSRSDVEYSDPHEITKFSQTKGLAFPKLESPRDVFPLRLFVLLPSLGDRDSPVRGCLVLSSVARHSCYLAVRHSRGNPSYWGKVYIDGRPVNVTKNLEVFLTHIRHPSQCRILYVRELCINRHSDAERTQFLTGQMHATIENCSCGIVEMNRAMYLLNDAGYISEPPRTSNKLWDEAPSDDHSVPFHMAMILRNPKPVPMDAIEEGLDVNGVSNLPNYEYVPLDIVASEIRVLAVYPAKDQADPVIVDVYYVPLHSNIRYHALSYCWGSSQTTCYIRDFMTKIAVTENLHNALVQFRSRISEDSPPQLIWADAVCMDQNNQAEKAQCIPRMHMVYDEAVVVFVYLLSLEGTSKAGALAKIIAEAEWDELHDTKTLQEVASLDDWADLYGLFQLPYFTRRWVVQELASASAPTIMIGRPNYDRALRTYSLAATLMASKLSELLEAWVEHKHPVLQRYPELQKAGEKSNDQEADLATDRIRQVFQRIKTLDFIRSLYKIEHSPSFLFLITLTQNAECIDPRDRIYSLWNIARERETSSIDIRYDRSVEDCYIGFTKAYISVQGSLEIIHTSQFQARANDSELYRTVTNGELAQLPLPSWCPDYRQKDMISSMIRRGFLHYGIHSNASMPELDANPYHADKLEPAAVCPRHFHFEGQQLVVQGILLDTVAFASSEPYQNTPVRSFDSVSATWMYDIHTGIIRLPNPDAQDALSVRPPQPPDEADPFYWMNTLRSEEERDALFDAFMSMVVGEATGSFPGHWTVEGEDPRPQWHCLGHDVSPLRKYLDYYERAKHVIRGRRLIITEQGYMGLAPWHVREGFHLAILCGCSVPVLLEHVDEAATQAASDLGDAAAEGSARQDPPGWYFRGDCFVQGWMEGQALKRYGGTTQEAWDTIKEFGNELRIN